MSDYTAHSIIKLSDLDAVRQNPAMYVGTTEDPTHLIFEAFDNSVDEAIAGYASILGIFIDTKKNIIKILDNGRGIPNNPEAPLEQDAPVMISTSLHTSGKFKKGETASAYKIATGLHGIGLTALVALSDWMELEIYRDGMRSSYRFENDEVDRNCSEFTDKPPYATKVTFKPNKKYFGSMKIDLKLVEERIRLVVANYPNLKLVFRVNDKDQIIHGTEKELITDYLSKNIEEWHSFEATNKNDEKCSISMGWEPGTYGPMKVLSSVNLVRVHSGVHINKIMNILRTVFQDFAKKNKCTFHNDDCLQGLRIYLNLFIIKTAFAAQVKTKLESSADISLMDVFEKQIKDYFNSNSALLEELLDRFQNYRNALQSKKLTRTSAGNRTRANTRFTKLRDCADPGGELLIGEGDSAVGGLIQQRDPKKHAILPLRGVIPNALTMNKKKLLENTEVKDIIAAMGTGIGDDCDISKLRYDKLILACDADPAGHWITSLLIILFSTLVPDVVKNGHVYVCRTPLFGVRRSGKFVPLWSNKEVEDARNKNEYVKRFKGLGAFKSEELKVFTLDESTRSLIPVTWSNNLTKIQELFTIPDMKRKLVMGQWSLNMDKKVVKTNDEDMEVPQGQSMVN